MRKYTSLSVFFILLSFIFISCNKTVVSAPVIGKFTPAQGSAGTVVVIKGAHFGNSITGTGVYFNGLIGTVSFVTDSSITAVVPDGATTGPISVSVDFRLGISKQSFQIFPGTWKLKAPIPAAPRNLSTGFAIDNVGFIAGGDDGTNILNDCWTYDPSVDQWTQKANLPVPLQSAVGFAFNNKGYIGIGKTTQGITASLWEYDPAADQWTPKTAFPGKPRFGGSAFVVGTKVYFGTGQASGQDLNDWWEYDPLADSWTRKADFPGDGRVYANGFVINDKLYFGLGSPNKNDWWEYDPATDSWTEKLNFPGTANYGTTGFAINGLGYIAGGSNQCWQYNSSADSWTQQAFYDSRTFSAAFTIGNKAYNIAGKNSDNIPQNDTWEFDPAK